MKFFKDNKGVFLLNSLTKRLTVLVIFPVALLLVLAGVSGFLYARNALIDQWREGAILKLERAAHYMDMRLDRPMQWMQILQEAGQNSDDVSARQFVLNRLESLEGVRTVNLEWTAAQPDAAGKSKAESLKTDEPVQQSLIARVSETSPPEFDYRMGQDAVTLSSVLKSEKGRRLGRLAVSLGFDHLMKDIKEFGWWQSQQVCLVDKTGRYLAHSKAMKGRRQLGETHDPVELAVLKKMQDSPFGTHLGAGHPPQLVSGFYRLEKAPWVLIMYAPGEEIMSPVVEFRFYFALAGGSCILLILLLIQFVGGRMVRQIRKISNAAEQVAAGRYQQALPVTTADELGQLEARFNEMVAGLREKDFIRDTFGRYVDRDIARELMSRPEASRLGGVKREVAILMSDIRNFTAIAEQLSPEATIRILNYYFSAMIDVIQQYKGIIVDFYGDGVLVFFDPHEGPLQPAVERALSCSLAMQKNMSVFNDKLRAENLPALETGIGVNAGQVVVGNIGSASRAKYGIVGSAVNITNRIQSEAKGGEVAISAPIYGLLSPRLKIKRSLTVQPKGVQKEMTLYLVTDFV